MREPMTRMELNKWLKLTAWDKPYWGDVHVIANALSADGCTGVVDYLYWTCLEHDIHYRLHKMLNGREIVKRDADYIFRVRIQQGSGMGVFSPIAWIRWFGVKVFGGKAWNNG